MSCPCDVFQFPKPFGIAAALARLPRALGAFPEWRTAVLEAIGAEPVLDAWRARDPADLGLMLAEMGAYVFDVVSFYDAVIANESYLRTAQLAGARRRHVALLGYVPRPAVAAEALLAAEADGRAVVKLPAGTAFRSGEFSGNPPQVFELTKATGIDPRVNRLEVARVRATALPASFSKLLATPGTVRLRKGDAAAFEFNGALKAVRIAGVPPALLRSRVPASTILLMATISPPAGTTYAQTRLLKGGAVCGLWKRGTQSGEVPVISGATLLLEARLPLKPGDVVLLEHGTTLLANRVTLVEEELRTLFTPSTSEISDGTTTSTITPGPIKIPVTRISLVPTPAWSGVNELNVIVHYACSEAATLLPDIKDTLDDTDPVSLPALIDAPRVTTEDLLLEDVHGEGVATTGTLDATAHKATLDVAQDWGTSLWAPVNLFGNTLRVTRGESVHGEMLGVGDARLAEQSFALKKKTLTYVNAASASGLASTLVVRVDGVQWHEAENFYGATQDDRIYIVRHDEDGTARVIFGGGARLPTGSVVTADYRHGAGAAAPPAASIRQIARSVAGLRAVRNVLPAFGGSDSESPDELAAYAPRSALLLGRAISLPDLEVATAQVGGVRAVRASWRWDAEGLRPAAVVTYIGDEQIAPTILGKLRALAEPDAAIVIERSKPSWAHLNVGITVDPEYVADAVIAAVLAALFAPVTLPGTGGLLRPEKLGPGGVLFPSDVIRAVMAVPGVTGIQHVSFNWMTFSEARKPDEGWHFDFELGGVAVNGETA